MRISTKGRYALRILIDIAVYQNSDIPRRIKDIAESQQISEKYVGRLIVQLRKSGFLKARRGVKGGYFLALPPEEISLLSVIESMEGDLSIVRCVCEPKRCKMTHQCPTRDVWSEINQKIKETFAPFHLGHFLVNAEEKLNRLTQNI